MKKYSLCLFTILCFCIFLNVSAKEFIGKDINAFSNVNNTTKVFHLTALIETDEDTVKGNVVKTTFKGSNCTNLFSTSAVGGNIFSDNTGSLSNSSYVDVVSSDTSANIQTVTGTNVEVIMQDRVFNKTPNTKYIKVPITIFGNIPFTCTITDLSITINGKEKEILELGSFFEGEKFSITDSINNTNNFVIYSDSNITINEKLIYNAFKSAYNDFSLEEFPYIKCNYRFSNSQNVSCTASTQKLFDNLILYRDSYGNASFKNNEITTSSVSFTYDIINNTFSMGSTINEVFPYYESSVVVYSISYNNSNEKSFTNYNPSILPGMSTDYDTKINKLNFNIYNAPLVFNPNLFSNDENFKKVCVNSNSSFSITKNHDDGVMSGSDHDFIWFPHGISGIKQFNYSTEMSNGYYEFENPYENFYFSSIDNINAIWNTEYMQDNFESKGYTDRYKYYGYTAYLFLHWYNFNDGQTYNFFPIFEVTDNVTTSHISSSGNTHGGGGTRLDGDEEIEISNEYCFYIKNEYEVNEVILDEWGDHYVSVNTPNGPINYGTTINKDKTDSESFLSQPIKFISEMSGTITFLNANIYNLYMSMPLVVRTFLITALIIFIVMLIMKLGGYQ